MFDVLAIVEKHKRVFAFAAAATMIFHFTIALIAWSLRQSAFERAGITPSFVMRVSVLIALAMATVPLALKLASIALAVAATASWSGAMILYLPLAALLGFATDLHASALYVRLTPRADGASPAPWIA